MGSLRHGKMEQAGARNGLKQTRISSRKPLKQTYGNRNFTSTEVAQGFSDYDAHRASELSNFSKEQLDNMQHSDTTVVHTDFNRNKLSLVPGTKTKPKKGDISGGFPTDSPVIPKSSASASTYTVTNPVDPSLNRSADQSPPKYEVPLSDFQGDVQLSNRRSGASGITKVNTFFKPTEIWRWVRDKWGNQKKSNQQQISKLEFDVNQRKVDAWNQRKEEDLRNNSGE